MAGESAPAADHVERDCAQLREAAEPGETPAPRDWDFALPALEVRWLTV